MATAKPNAQLLNQLKWRCVGPPRGGRVVSVAGHRSTPAEFYFGAVAGGIWKTNDGGQYWRNVSDGFLKTSSVGALAVAPSDPKVVYAGMGEACIRIDVSHGDGVYKSNNGGETWQHMGLDDTRHIGMIRVHPTNADLVYVAALGHAFGKNKQRGIFRSKDGGESWKKVLYVNKKAGATDLAIDPSNPRILYASIYQVKRTFWNLSSGGKHSGLYKSSDGGDTWELISNNPGFPSGMLGKMGVAVAPNGRVWAHCEAEGGTGLYRSDDGGATWQAMSNDPNLARRPWYYMHVHSDPQDSDTVYINNLNFWKSTDGGQSFKQITTRHGDNHALWINPDNTNVMIQGNDGGANVSFNGGESWSTIYNQMTAQFYRVTTDNSHPYRILGTQQDNSSISVPSRTGTGAISWEDCYSAGTGESGHIQVHPDDDNIVIVGAIGSSAGGGGALQKYDHRTKQIQLITAWPENHRGEGAESWKYRFQWTFPIRFSPHDSGVLYATANKVLKSLDLGQSWEEISPDLTVADPKTLVPSGGPITKDTTGAENYATIFTFEESPHEKGVMYAGSDDGLLHITKNGGKKWVDITPDGIPKQMQMHTIEISPHDAGTAYLAGTRYKLDDYKPYLYKTTDYGKSWQKITSGIPKDDFTRVIREDPERKGLLYAGTEMGVYVSFNDGDKWVRMGGNFPVVPVYDMTRKENDLVVATHGRSFWVLDGVTVLHQMADDMQDGEMHLFAPASYARAPEPMFRRWTQTEAGKIYMIGLGTAATMQMRKNELNQFEAMHWDCGADPSEGATIHYYLPKAPESAITLTILDADGEEVKSFTSEKPAEEDGSVRIPAAAGLNRFVWDMRYADASKGRDPMISVLGPMGVPGAYAAKLTVGDESQTVCFSILKDPRATASIEDLQMQFDLLIAIRDTQTLVHDSADKIAAVRKQVEGWQEKADADSEVATAAAALVEKLSATEGQLVQTMGGNFFDMNHPAKLSAKLANLPSVIASADSAPTKQSYAAYTELGESIDTAVAQMNAILESDVVAFNKLVAKAKVPAVSV